MSSKAKEKPQDAEEAPKDGAVEGEEGAPKKGKKKLVIIAAVVLLLVVGGAVAMLMGGKEETTDAHGEAAAHDEALTPEEKAAKDAAAVHAAAPVYYELPEFLVNLNPSAAGGRVSFLKMSVTLELKDAATVAVIDANKPRVQDIFNTYLRELRASDIQGSSGIYRLRTELLTRLNSTIEGGAVKDILFGEIIVQ